MSKGYMGRVLWVDLGKGTFEEEAIPDAVYEQYLGGYGLGAKLLFERIPKGADPLGPDNIFGIVSGLLNGTGALFAGRWQIVGKSPLTGGWGDANCGGDLAPAIKRTGFDGLFFTGISDKPVYLLIDGDQRELVDAGELWGKDAVETEDWLKERHGKAARVACIGQGGEQQSRISGVCNARGRIAARSGLGAVMGSKKLKAVVLKGKAKVELHDRKELLRLAKEFNHRLKRDKAVDKIFSGKIVAFLGSALRRFKTQPSMAGELFKFTLRVWGTAGITAMSAENGDSPVKNWKGVGFRDFPISTKSSRIGDDAVTRYETKKYGCNACPLSCGGLCSVRNGPYPIEETHKPEYESLCAFGTLCLIDDLERIYEINDRLNRAGIDTISAGTCVAWAMEAFERGLLTEKDLDGLRLQWGDADAALEVVQKIIDGEGIGKLLKDGVKRAAEQLGQGSAEFAIHAGGQELPMHDGRYDAGQGLCYEAEPTPGRHTVHSYTWADLMALHKKTRRMPKVPPLHTFKDRFGTKGKGEAQSIASRYMEFCNGAGMCLFGLTVGGDIPIVQWLNAATGWRRSFDDYLLCGQRIKTLRHAFNLREGITPEDTKMPERARGFPPLDAGPLKGITPPLDTLRQDFYRAMGWDPITAMPLDSTLKQLDLEQVRDELA